MKEIYPSIFLIEEKGARENIKPLANIFIFAGKDGLILDAGYGDKKTVKKFINEVKEIGNLYH